MVKLDGAKVCDLSPDRLKEAEGLFRAAGGRLTKQRLWVIQLLGGYSGYIDAQRLARLAQSRGFGVSEASVYRTLEYLRKSGVVKGVYYGNKKYYRLNSKRQPPNEIIEIIG